MCVHFNSFRNNTIIIIVENAACCFYHIKAYLVDNNAQKIITQYVYEKDLGCNTTVLSSLYILNKVSKSFSIWKSTKHSQASENNQYDPSVTHLNGLL